MTFYLNVYVSVCLSLCIKFFPFHCIATTFNDCVSVYSKNNNKIKFLFYVFSTYFKKIMSLITFLFFLNFVNSYSVNKQVTLLAFLVFQFLP